MDRGAWQAIVHGVTESQIQLSYQAHTQEAGTVARSSHNLRIPGGKYDSEMKK